MTCPKILVIVPAYNEAQNISRVIGELSAFHLPVDILVVDDGSSDQTSFEARKTLASVVTLPFNLGVGGAVQTGIIYAKQKGYDIAVQMDGDGQHDPRYLQALLQPVFDNKADMVIGSRFLKPFTGYTSSFVRRIGIHFFARLISFLTGYHVTDPTSGFRAFNRKAIMIFSKDYPVDFPEPEAIVLAKRYGLRLVEEPVEMRERIYGSSSIRYLRTLYYMIKVTFAIVLDMIKNKGRQDEC